MSEPARGYSWPPFEAGNSAAERHGANSERRIAPLAEQVEAELPSQAPWCARDAFAAARRRYARAEAVATLLWAYIAEHGPLDDDGKPRPALEALARWETTAARAGAALGLDVQSFAKLLGDIAGVPGGEEALAALQAEGRRILAARTDLVFDTDTDTDDDEDEGA